MTDRTLDRRTFVAATGTATLAALAGCSGGGDGGDGSNGSDGSDGSNGDGGSDGSDGEDGGDEYLAEEPDYQGWFDDVDNYEGTLDLTDREGVTVEVGADDGLKFAPAAIAVSAGTTVTWEWTGQGGQHNVADEDGAFESELVEEEGHTFEYTFEEADTFRYLCQPHESVGMKGAVVVR